jgi:hypothetical protein
MRGRLTNVETNLQLRHWLGQYATPQTAWTPVALTDHGLPIQQLKQLDHIALDLKDAAGHPYLCTPQTQQVQKQLNKLTNAVRGELEEVINLFNENSQTAGAAARQTVAGPLRGSQRIDREELTNGTHWTYRLQADTLVAGGTHGGILMQVDVAFVLADLRQAFTDSMRSVPLRAPNAQTVAQGFYVQIDAPAWLTGILAA